MLEMHWLPLVLLRYCDRVALGPLRVQKGLSRWQLELGQIHR